MAPEQAAQTGYSKEVDIWSCGIILYRLLNKGLHPLYSSNEGRDSYFNKLKAPVWAFPRSFPPLAQNLFLKLMKVAPIERYTASQALAHPWIIGSNGEIPKTYLESMRIYDAELKLRSFIYTFMFVSLCLPKDGIRFSRDVKPVVNILPKRKTYSAKLPEKLVRPPRHYKTFYEDFVNKSPVRPISGKLKNKLK